MKNNKTKRVKKRDDEPSKEHMWNVFNKEKEMDKMECIYDKTESGICSICNHILIIGEDGFNVCPNPKCGVLYTNKLDFSPEWKFHSTDDKTDPSRCGNPIDPILQESSFSGKILIGNKASNEIRKIAQWTKWKSMPHKEKSLNDELQYINIMAQKAGINEIFINHAMYIYKDLLEQKLFRGINRDSIKASSIYIACRLNGFPRTPFEIAEIFNIDKAAANSGCSMATDLMHSIERSIEPEQKQELCNITSLTFIERFCSKLNISDRLTLLAKFIANEVDDKTAFSNNNPPTIACGIVLFISIHFNLNIDKPQITKITGVSEVSIAKVFKKLDEIKDELIPNCFFE